MSEPTPGSRSVDRRVELSSVWEDLVEQIRRFEGFADFLKTPTFETLLPASRGVVNVSR